MAVVQRIGIAESRREVIPCNEISARETTAKGTWHEDADYHCPAVEDRCRRQGEPQGWSNMPFDPEIVAFLQILQDDLLGPAKNKDMIGSEAARVLLASVSEDERSATIHELDSGAAAEVPTPHESPHGYSILSELAAAIVEALSEDVVLPDPPLLGTLPLGWPTALLLRVPDSTKHLAVVDVEFTTFANLLAKACAQALLPDPDDPSEEAWQEWLKSSSHPGVQRYIEMMIATMNSRPAAAPPYLPPANLGHMVSQLLMAIEVFVVSEPFVYLAVGDRQVASPVTLATIHPRAASYLWPEAQRARCFMMRLAVTASVFDRQQYPDKAIAYWAIQMLLFTLALIQELQAVRSGAEVEGPSWAEQELGWLEVALEHSEGENSRSIALLNRLAPIRAAFAEKVRLALMDPESGVH
jgi:hypothetical protein